MSSEPTTLEPPDPTPAAPVVRNSSPVSFWLIGVLLVLVGMLTYRFIFESGILPGSGMRIVTPRGDLAPDEKSTVELFQNSAGSVVSITTTQFDPRTTGLYDQVASGSGSGVVWDKQGHILTNFHVIKDSLAKNGFANVTLANDEEYKSQILGFLPEYDLAVLQIDAHPSKLSPIVIGTSNDLQIGQKAFAIGSPFGMKHTLTAGLVSARRTIKADEREILFENLIQTDAAINPGSSGGPLLDSAGRMVGINTLIYSPSHTSAGIGFAVPIDTIMEVVPLIIEQRSGTRPGFGINLNAGYYPTQPPNTVLNVVPESAADRAGIRAGDVIMEVDDRKIDSFETLTKSLDGHKIGDSVNVVIGRRGATQTVSVKLQSLPERQDRPKTDGR